MCYLVAKWFSGVGSVAMKTKPGRELVEFVDKVQSEFGIDDLQLVTISRPSAYGEYEPYEFVESKEQLVEKLKQQKAA